jgi:hypothetical protein
MLRGLSTEVDVLGSFERLEDDDESNIVARGDKLVEICTFMEKNPVNRPITNLEWNPNHQELFLVGYSRPENEWDPDQPAGLVNVFSSLLPEQPEITLKC